MIKLNGVEIKPTIFSDGTSQVWKIPEEVFRKRAFCEQDITWEFESEAEFIHLAQLCDLLAAKGFEVDRLHIPYFPYARQDKEVSNNTTFAKKTFINLLKNLPTIKGISTEDVHSYVYNSKIHLSSSEPFLVIANAIRDTGTTLVCFPDKGALERYQYLPIFRTNAYSIPVCSFTKKRNQDTGYIESLMLNELVNIEDESVLIIDDICDGGMTFKLCAERLLTLGAKEVNLYTTHGIYSKGIQTLKDSGINRIFNRKGEVE